MRIHLGRNALVGYGWNIGTVQRNQPNVTRNVRGFRVDTDIYPQGQKDINFIKDLFSAITYAVWLTDQSYNAEHDGQRGIVSHNGFDPSDISPLRPQPDGRIFNFRGPRSSEYDLTVVLEDNPQGPDATILGPDGLFGNDANSVLAEVFRTGKMFGRTLPRSTWPVFERLERGISSDAIEQAKAARDANPNQRPNTQSAGYDPSTLSGDAQVAMGYEVTKPIRSQGQTWSNFDPSIAGILKVISIPQIAFRPKVSAAALATLARLPKSNIATDVTKPPPGVILPPPQPEPEPKPDPNGGSGGSAVASNTGKPKDDETGEESNLGLILGISAGVLVLGGIAVVVAKKKKKKAI